jgi:hypothetical protein
MIILYLKNREMGYRAPRARRVAWEDRFVPTIRYGKPVTDTESWCVLYDAPEGGNELARFKGSEVTGYTYLID